MGRIAALLLVPLVAAAAWYVYQSLPPRPVSPDKKSSTSAAAPSLASVLKTAGVNADRMDRSANGKVVIETADSLAVVERKLRATIPDVRVERKKRTLVVTLPGEKHPITFKPLRTVDSGAGLEEVESDDADDDDEPAAAAGNDPATTAVDGGEIVFILDDVGFERQPIDAAMALDPSMNFAIIGSAPLAAAMDQRLSSGGFEILCHLPMEPIGYPRISPGSPAILVSMNESEVRRTTAGLLANVPHASGVNNHMGSMATADRRVMTDVLRSLPRNLYFVDSRTTGKSVAEDVARSMSIRTMARDVFLDDSRSPDKIREQVRLTAKIASEKGRAVAIGHMYAETIAVLRGEIPGLKKRGFRLIRASEAVN